MRNLTSLSEREVRSMSNHDLCNRMNDILHNILYESYLDKRAVDCFPRESIKDFFSSKKIQSLPELHQRKALKKCFEYLVQTEYEYRVSGWVNQEIFHENYNENTSWLSPRAQIMSCAASQIKIVSSAIAWEKMRDLLHIISTGQNVPGSGKEKTKNFRKWILNHDNEFVFFAPNLEYIERFKEDLRNPEVHIDSKLSGRLLKLEKPPKEDNRPLILSNILHQMWHSLLEILNDKKPSTFWCTDIDVGSKWQRAVWDRDLEIIQAEIKRLKSILQKNK